MPELPEVETVKLGLQRFLPGKKIVGAESDWPKSFPNSQADVKGFLIGASVQTVKRRGKALIIELDTSYSLVIHLKMTGQLVFVQDARDKKLQIPNSKFQTNPNDKSSKFQKTQDEIRFGAGHPSDSLVGDLPDKSTRVIIDFTDGSKLFFNDQRKFGWVRLLPTVEVPHIDFFRKLGPEPLDKKFTSEQFRERLKRRPNTSIKAALLDQTVVAGIGNIYADESLWRAKIHPAVRVSTLSARRLSNLFSAVREVLNLAIKSGGSSDRNYVDAEGKKGSYLKFANVFRREGQSCPRCGTTVIKTRVAGRGTHVCPKCQKL